MKEGGGYVQIKILECRRFTGEAPLISKPRTVRDYEIDLEIGQQRIVVIDGQEQIIKRGDICVHKPGQKIYGKGMQDSILLTLDFSNRQIGEPYSRNIEGDIQPEFQNELIENLKYGVITNLNGKQDFITIYTELLNLCSTNRDSARWLVLELIYKLNAEIFRKNYSMSKPKETPCSKALNYIKNNLSSEITLEFLAELVHLDKNYFVRLFKSKYNKTPIKMLISMRMEKGCDLITNTDMSISEISNICGYRSPSYFICEYKKHFGITPYKQRKMLE